MDDVLISYCVVTGSFLGFQLLFSAISPRLFTKYSSTYRQLSFGKQCEWDSRFVSTNHALIVGSACLYILAYDDAVNADPIWGDPFWVKMNVAITCGYLVQDLLLLARFWKVMRDPYMVCHHLAVFYSYGYVLNRGVLPYFANFRLISELSTPFVNQRWFFDVIGKPRSSWPVLLNGLAMALVFFIVRIAVIPSYYSQVFATFGTEGYIRLGIGPQVAWIVSCVVLDILNVFWMYKIARGFYKVVKAKPDGKPRRNHAD
ncbi:TLC domain-containing protein 4-A isoform X1 [Xenopus laevis]|uniref:TLC domain-containing protein 4-A n=3 Tax=Xenopus laevis TaxID=8355 RepID=TLC4A_XENLA|nr:TLC domain-containing protein 4-A [Xenopus laevis]XP_018097512.1 TLC domain-containing protein 4-A isoform X1 [Xenopus laevis]XP_018097513.1 TLC domain-containing protein 4-A isoform X1 [Xenopus laevis]XP_041441031.1 TLC domain-containing protein 4-A isoform X1 [Xenopus laevis]XP_041441032.1 TLC domain-containing protein 4-A isoform X1 [Xenopus laevis]Q6GLX2.1 RecName: Full=TLC domain-containing protein 4-A; AltName: Full=Transmembrane protein 56-A [Xenopus laevis]AAH74322.1 MGC84146 prote